MLRRTLARLAFPTRPVLRLGQGPAPAVIPRLEGLDGREGATVNGMGERSFPTPGVGESAGTATTNPTQTPLQSSR